jgi:spore germination protein GerM
MKRRRTPPSPLAALLLFLLLLGACGDGEPRGGRDAGPEGPPDPAGSPEVPETDAGTPYTLALTFTRDEAPVQVSRMVRLARVPGVPEREQVLEAALGALVEGPRPEEREEGISSFFGPGTEGLLRGVAFRGDTAVVEFGDLQEAVPNASSSTGSFHFLMELNGTAFAVPGVEAVEYRMDGSCEAFWNFLQRSCQVVSRSAPV